MTDLSSQLTVFVIDGSNDPNITICLDALQRQNCKFVLDIIKDYKPMSLAFQEMLNRVKTPFFVQIDSDMVMEDWSIQKMYNDIQFSTPTQSMLCYFLKDVHLNKDIYGVKIYKTEIFQKYPYNLQHPSCEVEQLSRMEQDGYKVKFIPFILGQHSPIWIKDKIFERYYNLMEKYKIYGYTWMRELPQALIEKIKSDPSDLNIYALLGAASSIYSNKTMDKEKHSNMKPEDYSKLESFLNPPRQATLYMGNTCNFHCQFCALTHNKIKDSGIMTLEKVKLILEKFPTLQGFCLAGFSEPFLNKELPAIVRHLKSHQKFVGIISNGSLITTKLPEMLKMGARPDYISISLNAHTQQEHEAVTKTKTWEKVLAGVKLIIDSKINIFSSHVVSTQNLKDVPDMIRFVHSLGIQTLHLHNILPHFDSTYNKGFWQLVITKEHENIISQWKQMPESSIVKTWPRMIDQNGGEGGCEPFIFNHIGIDGNLNLSNCLSVLPCDNQKFGNLNDPTPWNSEKMKIWRGDYFCGKTPECKMCFRHWKEQ